MAGRKLAYRERAKPITCPYSRCGKKGISAIQPMADRACRYCGEWFPAGSQITKANERAAIALDPKAWPMDGRNKTDLIGRRSDARLFATRATRPEQP